MRFEVKILSLVAVAAVLCAFLLSGCGAQVCAFGNIGECPKTNKFPNNNAGSSGVSGQLVIEPSASEVRWGNTNRLLIRFRGGNANTRISSTIGSITERTANSFYFVPGGGSGRQMVTITLKAADYKEEYSETSAQNRGKFARAFIDITD